MKIEIGESLVYSWLKHVKCKKLVQTNWTPSKNWNFNNEQDIELYFKEVSAWYEREKGEPLFGKQTIDQLIHQSEIDVLAFDENNGTIYAVDVAFHSNGLNYGGNRDDVKTIIKKCARSVMCIYRYFRIKKGEVLFVTPKASKKKVEEIKKRLDELSEITSKRGFKITFRFLANEEFQEEIYQKVIDMPDIYGDTNELFSRSYQLTEIMKGSN